MPNHLLEPVDLGNDILEVENLSDSYVLPVGIEVMFHHHECHLYVNEIGDKLFFQSKKNSHNLLKFNDMEEAKAFLYAIRETYDSSIYIFKLISLSLVDPKQCD